MLWLYIVAALAVITAVILLWPLSITWQYDEKTALVLKYLFFNVDLLHIKKEEKPQNEGVFAKYRKKYGNAKAAQRLFDILKQVVKKAVWLFKKLKFKAVILEITVAGENAAYTAVEYGAVCAAVYPAVSFVSSVAETQLKKIDVSADFEGDKWAFKTSGTVKCRAVWALWATLLLIIALVKNEVINIKGGEALQ